jgi:hypothetical protein
MPFRWQGMAGTLSMCGSGRAQCLRTKPEVRDGSFYVILGSVIAISVLSGGAALAFTMSQATLDACRAERSIARCKLPFSARRESSPSYAGSFPAEGHPPPHNLPWLLLGQCGQGDGKESGNDINAPCYCSFNG